MAVEATPEPRWPASLALAVCVGLYLLLPGRLVVGPQWIVPSMIALLIVPLLGGRHRHPNEPRGVRHLTITLIALVTVANVISMGLLVHHLLHANVVPGSGAHLLGRRRCG